MCGWLYSPSSFYLSPPRDLLNINLWFIYVKLEENYNFNRDLMKLLSTSKTRPHRRMQLHTTDNKHISLSLFSQIVWLPRFSLFSLSLLHIYVMFDLLPQLCLHHDDEQMQGRYTHTPSPTPHHTLVRRSIVTEKLHVVRRYRVCEQKVNFT